MRGPVRELPRHRDCRKAAGVTDQTKTVTLNEGAQRDFVKGTAEASGYFGGIGSGKTWAGIIKGLKSSFQPIAPGSMWGPRGLIGASSEGVLKKIVVPQFMEIMAGTNLWKTGRKSTSWVRSEMKARLVANCGCDDPHACDHEVEVYLASLHDPDELRGMELTWFFIDEGRNVTKDAWNVLWGRLRQGGDEIIDDDGTQVGYTKSGFVCSTTNGFDWMYDLFHPESTSRLPESEWFNATSFENQHNTGKRYIARLQANYHGRMYEQEVLGLFVGVTEGAVFFEWDPSKSMEDVVFDRGLPLYSEWDFGYGDLNVVLFFQLTYEERVIPVDGTKIKVTLPTKHYIAAMEGEKRTSKVWAGLFKEYCLTHFDLQPRDGHNFGDPAGMQTQQTSGTSVIADLAAHGVFITPAPKMPVDHAVRILNNMMADGRVKVDKSRCERLSKAFAAHKWPTDNSGNRKSNTPVHDWTSHYCDAARYGTTVLISPFAGVPESEPDEGFPEGTFGNLMAQLDALDEDQGVWLGPQDSSTVTWQPTLRPRS